VAGKIVRLLTVKIGDDLEEKITRVWRNVKADCPGNAPSKSGVVREALTIGLDILLKEEGG